MKAPRAVVFGYHGVAVRGLQALLDIGVDVRLVVTHPDDPADSAWFPSLATAAQRLRIPCIAPQDVNAPRVFLQVAACEPDHLYSLYYRQLLKAPLLALPRRREFGGAFNVHGSLLPRYRGRAPVNWAVLHGESRTGATLHAMDERADHGAIVEQCAVDIGPDETAYDVLGKVIVAADTVLRRGVPKLLDGSASLTTQDEARASRFGRRGAQDGEMPARASAQALHDLVRAVARPYPGAFFDTASAGRVVVWRTQRSERRHAARPTFKLRAGDGALWLDAADGRSLRVLEAELGGRPLDASDPVLPLYPTPTSSS